MAKLHDGSGEVWCRTDYSEWYSAFSKFTPLTYAEIAVWGMVPPLAILAWGRRGLLGANGLSHQVDVAVKVRCGWE